MSSPRPSRTKERNATPHRDCSSPFASTDAPSIIKRAQWIWAENHQWDLYNCFALFRKSFTVARIPRRCHLVITADQSYQLYVNGAYVCRGPARGFQAHWPYDVVDISPYLRRNKNVLAVRAYHPGISTFQYVSRGFAGLIAAFRVANQSIVTDLTWLCRRQAGVSRQASPSSLQLFPQEHIDARLECPNWMSPNFDDSQWNQVAYSRPWNSMPWPRLESRGIPMLHEEIALPSSLLGVQFGECAPGAYEVRDVVSHRAREGFDFAQAGGDASPLDIPVGPENTFSSYLADFSRTTVGCLELQIEGAAGGEIIDALFAETISLSPLRPDIEIDTHCRLALGVRLICRKGFNQHRFFHPVGFRYLILTVRKNSTALRIAFHVHQVGYPLRERGSFSSSNSRLERIWKACAWTQRCCSLDAYVDTPWREQAQWWGDARVQARNTFYLDGDDRLFRRGIHCIASQTTPDGVTYGHSPTIAHECILPDFTLTWLLTLWDHYWQTGSTEAFQSHLAVATKALDYFHQHTDKVHGLLRKDGRYWLFLDWADLFQGEYSAIYNLWYLQALEKIAILASLSGYAELARQTGVQGKSLRKALSILVGRDGLIRDGMDGNGRLAAASSVHAQTLAIMNRFNLSGTESMLSARLLPAANGYCIGATPSPFWFANIYSVLIDRGFEMDVVGSIERLWTPMAEYGTTWEVFNPKRGRESFSHAWSAHPLYLLAQTIGGIRQDAPGWTRIHFKPIFLGESGRATVPSPRGLIRSSWKISNDQISVTLALPQGVEASVALPGYSQSKVQGKHTWTIPHLRPEGNSHPASKKTEH